MALPIVLLVGHSGVGKDTVANAYCDPKYGKNAIKIALADPAKRIAQYLFGFIDEQLWGDSKYRDIKDPRLYEKSFYENWRWELSKRKLTDKDRSIFYKFDSLNVMTNRLADGRIDCFAGLSPRDVIKIITESYVNSKDRYYWVNYAKETAKELLSGGYTYTPQQGLIENDGFYDKVVVSDGRHLTEVVSFAEVGAKIVLIDALRKSSDDTHRSVIEIDKIPREYFNYKFYNEICTDDEFRSKVYDLTKVI